MDHDDQKILWNEIDDARREISWVKYEQIWTERNWISFNLFR